MQRTNIYLDESQCQELDRLARSRGTSRAALVRELIDRALGSDIDDLAGDLAAIDESFGVLAEDDLRVVRQPDERWSHLERVDRA
ncbi:MAG: ribbon-helix-helix protein, CopG family [Egibacteraceae bacterium]|jgi:predicted DNA-binding protein